MQFSISPSWWSSSRPGLHSLVLLLRTAFLSPPPPFFPFLFQLTQPKWNDITSKGILGWERTHKALQENQAPMAGGFHRQEDERENVLTWWWGSTRFKYIRINYPRRHKFVSLHSRPLFLKSSSLKRVLVKGFRIREKKVHTTAVIACLNLKPIIWLKIPEKTLWSSW